MASGSSWVPDEDSSTLFSERCWLQGAIVSAFAYGVAVPLYILSFYHLVRGRNRIEFKKRLPLLIYITVTFVLETISMVTIAAFIQMAFVDDRNYPGGPSAFENDKLSNPIPVAGNIASVLSNWLSDALVVWRFKVIYHSCWVPLWVVMFFPCLLLAGSVAMGIRSIMFQIQVSPTNPYVTNGSTYTLPYLSFSLALNVILTIAIVLRLLTFRYRIVSVMGTKYGTHYTSATTMIIESAALYSAICVAFLVVFKLGNAVSQVFIQSWIQFQLIATLLIVFRVAQGKEWNQNTTIGIVSGVHRSGMEHMQFQTSLEFTVAPDSYTKRVRSSGGELGVAIQPADLGFKRPRVSRG